MQRERDPVARRSGPDRDLYDVATWEPRSRLDRLSVRVYRGIVRTTRGLVILVGLAILLAQFALGGLGAVFDPTVTLLTALSAFPALALTIYVWRSDNTSAEPLGTLVVTFMLGIVFAMFAAVLNSLAQPLFGLLPAIVGLPLFFYVFVAPVEETVKWLAVRLHAFRSDRFDHVIDGAVYGAVAGFGFATIENAAYITRQIPAGELGATTLIGSVGGVALLRSLAGPGHVIYSSFAGYYLGLAKFNRENAGPIAVKGLLIAAFIHGTYNTLVSSPIPLWLGSSIGGVSRTVGLSPEVGGIFMFIAIYDGLFGYWLYRKLKRYSTTFRAVNAETAAPTYGELTEYER